jgi:acetyl-CoA/propionyl-CoA carboxylase carboxyl transferase subunit
MEDKIRDLHDKRREAHLGGGEEAVDKQHDKGKLTARERIDALLDDDSFFQFDEFAVHRATEFGMEERKAFGDGVVTGTGTVHGRKVVVYAQDFTFMGGSTGLVHCRKIRDAIRHAMKIGCPVIGFNDSGGARIQEGIDSLHGLGEVFHANVMASGVVPQIVAVTGPCAGGAVYSPALMDFIFMVRGTSYMFITGPRVIAEVTSEKVGFEDLGGADVHSTVSGVSHFAADSEQECIQQIRRLLSYIPGNNVDDPPLVDTDDPPDRMDERLEEIVPTSPKKVYDMREVVERVVDKGSLFQVMEGYDKNAIVGFARLSWRTVGIIANQPMVYAGCLDIDASDKVAKFIRFCNAFNLPLITFEDLPGFLPGVRQEHGGIIRHGAKVLFAYSEATVPKILVIVRKGYGGGYIAMCSKGLEADFVLAWPTAEVAVMGPEGAVEIVHRREIEVAEDPDSKKKELAEEFREAFASPYVGAEARYINEVIEPRETRPHLVRILDDLLTKRAPESLRYPRKHRNIPM